MPCAGHTRCRTRLCPSSAGQLEAQSPIVPLSSARQPHLLMVWRSRSLGCGCPPSCMFCAVTPLHFSAGFGAWAGTVSRRWRPSTVNSIATRSAAPPQLSWAAEGPTCSCQLSGEPQELTLTTMADGGSWRRPGRSSRRGQMTSAHRPIDRRLRWLCPQTPAERSRKLTWPRGWKGWQRRRFCPLAFSGYFLVTSRRHTRELCRQEVAEGGYKESHTVDPRGHPSKQIATRFVRLQA